MFPKSKVTEIYCMTDDFCKEFSFQQEKYMIEDKKIGHRNKPNRMSDAEMMVILILFHSGVSAASSIITKSMSANIWNTCFRTGCPITVLWNWRRKYCFS